MYYVNPVNHLEMFSFDPYSYIDQKAFISVNLLVLTLVVFGIYSTSSVCFSCPTACIVHVVNFAYNTRNANTMHVRFRRTNYTKHTISGKGVATWNILIDNNNI